MTSSIWAKFRSLLGLLKHSQAFCGRQFAKFEVVAKTIFFSLKVARCELKVNVSKTRDRSKYRRESRQDFEISARTSASFWPPKFWDLAEISTRSRWDLRQNFAGVLFASGKWDSVNIVMSTNLNSLWDWRQVLPFKRWAWNCQDKV